MLVYKGFGTAGVKREWWCETQSRRWRAAVENKEQERVVGIEASGEGAGRGMG